MAKHKTSSEIFGNLINEEIESKIVDEIKKDNYKCPFLGAKCRKQSRLISYPMGVCSVYQNDKPIIICPDRFIQNETILKDIAKEFFGSINNTLYFSEVHLTKIGSFDYILVKHKPLIPKVEDFIILEVQSDSTTGTGKLVQNLKEFMGGDMSVVNKNYSFGMNTYNTIKLAFIQILNKGIVAEKWNKNIVWVMQDFIFQNMLNRFELKRNKFDKEKNNHFFIYSLKPEISGNKKLFKLSLDDHSSFTIKELAKAFSADRNIPPLTKFIKKLEEKLKIELRITN